MRKVLIEGPILTQSGYGEHSRFVYRSLKDRDDVDIYVLPLGWGTTSWLQKSDKETEEIQDLIKKTLEYTQNSESSFDTHIHVGIPQEFERKAPEAIHVTAGIESTKISKKWVAKTYEMDKIIVPSEHAAFAFRNTSYDIMHEGELRTIKCECPIEVVPYPVKKTSQDKSFKLDLDYKFNFLSVAMMSPRKNMDNMVKWFVEEFKNDEVGLVLKTSLGRGSLMDKRRTEMSIKNILESNKERKCKVYLLHGDLTEEQMTSLYNHTGIKCMVSATHGEGFGLPLFEAAINEMPIVAPSWSGHTQFLREFEKVEYSISHIQDESVWGDILIKESMWCYPKDKSFKKAMRNVFSSYSKHKSAARRESKRIMKEFESSKIHKVLSSALVKEVVLPEAEYVFVSDFFHNQVLGGAELSLQSIIDSSPSEKVIGINSSSLSKKQIEFYKNKKWIFGNTSRISEACYEMIQEAEIDYSFIEYDYKFCKYRNPVLYEMVESEECDYEKTELSKRMVEFMNSAKSVFFMSKSQMDLHKSKLKSLRHENLYVLSSTFKDEFFEAVDRLKNNEKDDKWLVLKSDSWVKGVAESENWCKENNKNYELVGGLSPIEFLEKLSKSKGVCFKPSGLDTCPRFIIEAKLLGCELELNENVQHAKEEWFTESKEVAIEYLKGRTSFFWEKAFV